MHSGKRLVAYKGCGAVLAAAFSPDGGTLAGATRKEVCSWNARTGKRLPKLSWSMDPVAALAFPSDLSLALAAAQDGVSVWDLGKRVLTERCSIPQLVPPAQFAAGAKLLAWGDAKDPTVHVLDVQACKEVRTFDLERSTKASKPKTSAQPETSSDQRWLE